MAKSYLALGLVLVLSTGCGLFTKRHQECCCPTDIRQMHWPWMGEDAVFDTPCGPDAAYHGYKPTCWREWQAPAAVWRDEFCGGAPSAGFDAPALVPQYPVEMAPAQVMQPQPAMQPEVDSTEALPPVQPLPEATPPVQPALQGVLPDQSRPEPDWNVAPEDASKDLPKLPSLDSPPSNLEDARSIPGNPFNQAHYHYLRTATPGDSFAKDDSVRF